MRSLMKKIIAATLVSFSLLGLGGCASNLDNNTYSRGEARMVQNVMVGTIVGLRGVQIEGTRTPIGALAGAGVGGLAGSTIGGGRGSVVAAIAGAVGGGLLGYAAEERLTSSNGVEITVSLDDGRTISVVQEVSNQGMFRVGDRVRVVGSYQNYRVTF